MRPDQLHGYHAAHVNDRLPWWFLAGLIALAGAGAFTAAIWIERIWPGWI